MKKKQSISKSKLFAMLAKRGIKFTRDFQRKLWVNNFGDTCLSLSEIYERYFAKKKEAQNVVSNPDSDSDSVVVESTPETEESGIAVAPPQS